MAGRRSSWMLASAALAGLLGCAHSDDEWKAKLREVDDLNTQLESERAQHGTSKKALEDEGARLERLEHDLSAAGIDPARVAASAQEQARAMEEHRRAIEHRAAAKKRLALLRDKLAPLSKNGVAVTVRRNRVVIVLPGDALFDTGREALKKTGKDLLVKVAEVLRSDRSLAARPWQVAGHVDANKPGAFKDGWGLSVMRAREVLAFMVQPVPKGGGGLAASHWSAAGFGDVDPIDPGGSAEAKKANRRCEIVALPSAEETLDLEGLGR